jgi:hypothetical protein
MRQSTLHNKRNSQSMCSSSSSHNLIRSFMSFIQLIVCASVQRGSSICKIMECHKCDTLKCKFTFVSSLSDAAAALCPRQRRRQRQQPVTFLTFSSIITHTHMCFFLLTLCARSLFLSLDFFKLEKDRSI